MWYLLLVFLFASQAHAGLYEETSGILNSLLKERCFNRFEQGQFDECYNITKTTFDRAMSTTTWSERAKYSFLATQMMYLENCMGEPRCEPLKKIKFILAGSASVILKLSKEAYPCVKSGSVLERDNKCSSIYLSSTENEAQFVALNQHRDDVYNCIDEPLRKIEECDDESRKGVAYMVYSMIDVLSALSPEINPNRIYVFDRFNYSNFTLPN